MLKPAVSAFSYSEKDTNSEKWADCHIIFWTKYFNL